MLKFDGEVYLCFPLESVRVVGKGKIDEVIKGVPEINSNSRDEFREEKG